MAEENALTMMNQAGDLVEDAPEFDMLVNMIVPEDKNAVGVVAATSARVIGRLSRRHCCLACDDLSWRS